jgi:putative tryptophan/tyrosine transport system substrate-binding protein
MMDRRRFIVTAGFVLLAAPLAAWAQPAGKVWRIGVLSGVPERSPRNEALREFGYVEGQNIVIEWRSAHGRNERFPSLTAELVRLNVDVIVAGNDPAVEAARRATRLSPLSWSKVATLLARGLLPVSRGREATSRGCPTRPPS